MKIVLSICVFVLILTSAILYYNSQSKVTTTADISREEVLENGESIDGEMTPEGIVSQESSDVAPSSPNTLDLSEQNLTRVPNEVFSRTELEILDVSSNRLTGALQAEVRNLKSLRILNLSENQFTGVPAEVGQLSQLEILDLSQNQLTGLPYELGSLSKLRVLDLRGNEYSKQDLAKIRETLQKSTQVLVD